MLRYKGIIIFLVAVSFIVVPFGASSIAASKYPPERSPALMLIDGVVVRPFQLSSLVIGTISFVLTAPWSALGGNMGEAYTKMMVEPARQTFKRPLGGF